MILGSTYQSRLWKLILLQKKAIQIIYNINYHDHTSVFFHGMVPDKANCFTLKNKHHPQTIVTRCQSGPWNSLTNEITQLPSLT